MCSSVFVLGFGGFGVLGWCFDVYECIYIYICMNVCIFVDVASVVFGFGAVS